MSILDDLILKIDNSVGLYDKLKAFDEHWGVQVRASLESMIREDFSLTPDNLLYWGSFVVNIEHLSPFELFSTLLFKTNAAGTGSTAPKIDSQALVDAYKEGQRNQPKVALNYRPIINGDNSIKVTSRPSSNGPVSDSPVVPARKLRRPDLYSPGTSSTDFHPPISAQTQLISRRWGELACYPIEAVGTTSYIPATAFEAGSVERSEQASDAFMAFLGIDAIPLPAKEKEILKESLSYWAASGFIAPQFIQGLAGDVGFYAGSEFILKMAEALNLRSKNAAVGTDATFYLDTEFAPFPGTVASERKYADVPFFAGRSSLKQDVIDLAGKDIGYFLGVPWEQRTKALPKNSNLQILFYGKPSPPYGSGRPGSPRLRPAVFNLPDPLRKTWAEIKAVCLPYQSGPIQCSVVLSDARKLAVFASTKEEGRNVLNRMLTLCTATKSGDFTYVETEGYGRDVTTMYVGSAVLDASQTSENPGKAKFLLYVDREEDANFRIYDTAPTP